MIMDTVEDVFQLIRLLEESGAGERLVAEGRLIIQQRQRSSGRRPFACYGCGEEGHRIAVCPQRTVRPPQGQVNAVKGGDAGTVDKRHRRVDCTHENKEDSSYVLPIVSANIATANGGPSKQVKVLLDTGSNLTLAIKDLRSKAKSVSKKKVTFGGVSSFGKREI